MVGYKMPPRGSGPTSRNRYKKLQFSALLHFSPSIPKEASLVYLTSRDHEDRLQIRSLVRRGGLRRRPRCPGAGETENLPETDTR